MDELEPYEPTEWDRAMELVREWRDNADVLEACPGLIRWADDPQRFERELWDAKCTLDAIDAGEIASELDAEFGDDEQDDDEL
jgi:hypothetical protein